ncbi:MAG: hypothetical protein WBA25_00065 [Jannaschia sp.]
MKHTALKRFVLGLALAALPHLAGAVPLAAGDTVFLPGTTVAAEPGLGGTVINDNIVSDFIGLDANGFFGIGVDIQNRVVRSTLDGSLIFMPRVLTTFNNSGGNFLVDRMTLFGFGGYDVDVNYRTDGLGDRGPTSATRSGDGQDLIFDFGFPLVGSNLFQNPREDSLFLSLNTDERAFSLTGRISVFARHIDYPGQTYRFDYGGIAVPAPVPLPASFLLLLAALGGTGVAMRGRSVR